ncbi:MAG: GNAT family N-acetyltransferase [Chloroflexota bacterium]
MTNNYILRKATKDDIPAIAAVINASSMDTLGTTWAVTTENGELRQGLWVEESSEKVVVTTKAGQVVAYQHLYFEEPYITSEAGGFVHPNYRGQGIGTMLLDWAETRATEMLSQAPLGVKTVLAVSCFDTNKHTLSLLKKRGHTFVHEWPHLKMPLSTPPALVDPEGITIRPLNFQTDWPATIEVLIAAFRDHWGVIIDESALEFPGSAQASEPNEPSKAETDTEAEENEENYDPYSNTPGLCFVALDGDRIVGGCLCEEKNTEFKNTGRLGSLFIHPDYRRRGIGEVLSNYALDAYIKRGYTQVITDTDAESFTGAIHLYQKLGMKVYRRQHTYEKTIRAGREVRALRVEDLAK